MTVRIHLVRHGLSESNLDLSINRRKPDHAIELASKGEAQALFAGKELAKILNAVPGFQRKRLRMLVSPYQRTRQTAAGVGEGLTRSGYDFQMHESLQLREQSFGLFDGIPDDELAAHYPAEHSHYAKHVAFEGEFFAPLPLGESRAQVCDRVRSTFDSIQREMRGDSPVTDTIVISHGVTIRCFLKEWLHLPWEWCERQPNPSNCSITTIEGRPGQGWKSSLTFEGFEHTRETNQDRREEGHLA